MTVVRYKNRPVNGVSFNNLLSDVFPQLPSLYRDEFKPAVPVNITENETAYSLNVVAPGFDKEAFSLNVENNLLTISVEAVDETVKEGVKAIRSEYAFKGFKRSFNLDEKINADAITAQYVNGVLTVTLPKKEEVKPAAKQISIQ